MNQHQGRIKKVTPVDQQKGMTLVEVVMMAGLISVVMAAATTMMSHFTSFNQTTNMNFEMQNLDVEVRHLLMTNCLVNLAQVGAIDPNPSLPTNRVYNIPSLSYPDKNGVISPQSIVVARAGGPLGWGATINSIDLQDVYPRDPSTAASRQDIAGILRIRVAKPGAVGGQFSRKDFPIWIRVDDINQNPAQITDCGLDLAAKMGQITPVVYSAQFSGWQKITYDKRDPNWWVLNGVDPATLYDPATGALRYTARNPGPEKVVNLSVSFTLPQDTYVRATASILAMSNTSGNARFALWDQADGGPPKVVDMKILNAGNTSKISTNIVLQSYNYPALKKGKHVFYVTAEARPPEGVPSIWYPTKRQACTVNPAFYNWICTNPILRQTDVISNVCAANSTAHVKVVCRPNAGTTIDKCFTIPSAGAFPSKTVASRCSCSYEYECDSPIAWPVIGINRGGEAMPGGSMDSTMASAPPLPAGTSSDQRVSSLNVEIFGEVAPPGP